MPFQTTSLTFSDGTIVPVGKLVIIIGPNNAGKSRALQDIENLASGRTELGCVITDISVELPYSLEQFTQDSGVGFHEDENNNVGFRTLDPSLKNHWARSWHGPGVSRAFENIRAMFERQNPAELRGYFGPALITRLGTEERLNLAKRGPAGRPDAPPQTVLQLLYVLGKDAEERLNRAIITVLKTRVRLDYSTLTELVLRLGHGIEKLPGDPREARELFQPFETIDEQGDGIRSFAAVCLAIDVVNRPLTLIDEPEAFLHPPQAAAAGRHVGSNPGDRQIIIATHSTDFLRGFLATAPEATVIRLTRRDNINMAKVISAGDLQQIIRDPLLSSSRVIDGLFYTAAVVTEGDADRAFYEAVGQRIKANNDTHFVNAHGKHTIPKIVKAYRATGVPCASIVDMDILKEEADLRKLLDAHGASAIEVTATAAERAEIAASVSGVTDENRLEETLTDANRTIGDIQASVTTAGDKLIVLARLGDRLRNARDPWRPLKANGVLALSSGDENVFDALARRSSSVGVFIVTVGELEGWLREYGVDTANKHEWIVKALQLLPSLIVDSERQPWLFVRRLFEYIE